MGVCGSSGTGRPGHVCASVCTCVTLSVRGCVGVNDEEVWVCLCVCAYVCVVSSCVQVTERMRRICVHLCAHLCECVCVCVRTCVCGLHSWGWCGSKRVPWPVSLLPHPPS